MCALSLGSIGSPITTAHLLPLGMPANHVPLVRELAVPVFRNEKIAALEVTMPLDLAVPCGIIINEMVTNALKYAFPGNIQNNKNDCKDDSGRATCRILVSLDHQDDIFTLKVADNGVGLPPGYDWSTAKTMGLTLVRMLGQHQLGAQYEISCTEGTTFTLIFSARNGNKNHG